MLKSDGYGTLTVLFPLTCNVPLVCLKGCSGRGIQYPRCTESFYTYYTNEVFKPMQCFGSKPVGFAVSYKQDLKTYA